MGIVTSVHATSAGVLIAPALPFSRRESLMAVANWRPLHLPLRSPASKPAKTLGRGEFHVSAVQNWRLISFSQGQLFFISFKISQDTHRSPNGVSGHTTVVIKSESSHACLLAHCYQQSDATDGCT